MKNPFRKSLVQKLETTIALITNRAEKLAAKRAAAQDSLDMSISARQQALLEGDLDDQLALDKVQTAVATATSDLAGIDDALAVLAQQKAEAERQLAAEHERIKRAAAADKLAEHVAAIEAVLPGYLEQSRVLADALSGIGHWHFESGQIAGFVQNTMGQIEVAANFALAELKAMPDAIRQGRQAIPGEPAPLPVAPTELAPPTMMVFMLRSARYRDDDGRKRFAGQWEDATMPVTTAQRALRLRAAVPITDPRRAQLRGTRGGDFDPNASDVVDLDKIDEDNSSTGIADAPRVGNFQVIDRGVARTGTISVTRL